MRFSHKEYEALSAIADRIAADCGGPMRQLPCMFRYFTGQDVVAWMLRNLKNEEGGKEDEPTEADV